MKAESKPETQKTGMQPIVTQSRALSFPPGLYRLTVKAGDPERSSATQMPLPALLVATAPQTPVGAVEFIGMPAAISAWMSKRGEMIGVRVAASGATLVFSSMSASGDGAHGLEINVEQISALNDAKGEEPQLRKPSLKLKTVLHLRELGDQEFVNADWAGRPGSGAWVEAFSILPMESLRASDIEYKALSANGFETPWISDGAVCGTKGVSMPLVGFAVRLRPSVAAQYDLEYSAHFRSGTAAGPLRGGMPCRSKVAGDPIDAIQIRILPKTAAQASSAPTPPPAAKAPSKSAAPVKAAAPVPAKASGAKTGAIKAAPAAKVPAKAASKKAAKPEAKAAAKPAAKTKAGAAVKKPPAKKAR